MYHDLNVYNEVHHLFKVIKKTFKQFELLLLFFFQFTWQETREKQSVNIKDQEHTNSYSSSQTLVLIQSNSILMPVALLT